MQIKMFSSNCYSKLEEQVNLFLKDNKHIRVRQITNTECSEGYSIMIVYEPRMDMIE
jgi:hypothetical protein